MKKNMQDFVRETSVLLNPQISMNDVNKQYKFYVDETNNIRSFKLTSIGFNTDESKFFVLGGLVFEKDMSLKTINLLWNRIPESKKQSELKFKTIKQGAKSFDDLLKKPYFQQIINWLYENSCWIHFYYMDNFYYSIVDIVDSLPFDSDLEILQKSKHLKTALYQVIKYNRSKSLAIFRDNTYPNVTKPRRFLKALEELVSEYMTSDAYNVYYADRDDNSLQIIQQKLKRACPQELIFLSGNEPQKLIEEYYLFYSQMFMLFGNSKFIFDHEVEIEKNLKQLKIKKPNYQFVESNLLKAKEKKEFVDESTHKLIQLSDIIVGMIGMFLEYINSDDVQFLQNIYEATKWSEKQCQTYEKWISIIKRSIQENSAFKGAIVDEFFECRFNFYLGKDFNEKIKRYNR